MLCDGCGHQRNDLLWVDRKALRDECRAGAEVEDTTVGHA